MKYIKRISLIFVAVFVLACSVPLSSIAVDPVSAATMANAFAQAITAYGASQGVSMTFDVTNTEGIGEGVHDLWDQYAADMAQSNVTVSDYSNLASSVFPTLWKKTFDYVTVSLDAATVGEIDGFWNWLLSGPAEMTKVDNSYYEWTLNQNNTVDPITVYTLGQFPELPVTNAVASEIWTNGTLAYTLNGNNSYYSASRSGIHICFVSLDNMTTKFQVYGLSNTNGGDAYAATYWSNYYTTKQISSGLNPSPPSGIYGTQFGSVTQASGDTVNPSIPMFASLSDAYAAFADPADSNIAVQPYVGDTAPQNVYIPDNNDINYTPVAAEIPLDMLWDDSLFGDGTGTLTDAQSEAITQAADDAITDNPAKTLELADTANPPAPSPSEVYIPFLPVTLPSFNFSLSGIWHYVTAWVASLGAWFSLVFTTWSYLPYAISVPVYATAVIVIVLGVYKRFFM